MLGKRNGGAGGSRGGAPRSTLIAIGTVVVAVIAALQVALEQPPEPAGAPASSPPMTTDETEARAEAPSAPTPAAKLPFDYFVLALTWSPSFCLERPDAEQCGQGKRFLLHGLWPNLEDGWRSDCDSRFRRPNQALLSRYAPLSAGAGLLAYQWRKHGTCSGLSPEAYFKITARAYASIDQPETLTRLDRDLDVAPDVIEEAFLEANPQLDRDGVTVKCAAGRLSEIRICLTPDLKPRKCGAKTVRDCGARSIDLPAPR